MLNYCLKMLKFNLNFILNIKKIKIYFNKKCY